MLRLPKFELASPTTVTEAVAMLASTPGSMVIAGGTDLLPNVKHELFTPPLVVSLADIAELRGIRAAPNGWTTIGAMTSLADVAAHELVRARFPALAQAAGLVAGPQLRAMGTLGGNVLLDTRCQWYNQTYFWREALGFCLKKDGTLCHVVEGGSKCVAAASNDTAPPLMTLRANLVLEGPKGRRTLPIDDLWLADGAYNKKLEPNEVLVEVQIPPTTAQHRGAYGKLRERGSIDFPLFGVAVRLELDAAGAVDTADAVVTAMQARPLRLKRFQDHLKGRVPGTESFEEGAHLAADSAYAQCHPMPNIPGDEDWRREMVPVYVRRTILAASRGEGPVHHV
ncbi:MAG: FAD binding domain-containing protein [Planctomycetota bacterium]|nr:FAD binding domain-containing protein [Planctomycetota bacterium]